MNEIVSEDWFRRSYAHLCKYRRLNPDDPRYQEQCRLFYVEYRKEDMRVLSWAFRWMNDELDYLPTPKQFKDAVRTARQKIKDWERDERRVKEAEARAEERRSIPKEEMLKGKSYLRVSVYGATRKKSVEDIQRAIDRVDSLGPGLPVDEYFKASDD